MRGRAADSSASVSAPQIAITPPSVQRASIQALLPTRYIVYPDVVSTPTPTMLATTTNTAIQSPNSAGMAATSAAGPFDSFGTARSSGADIVAP